MRSISDPVYGSIKLEPIEDKLIRSKTFQRLHNVKQLGLAHFIFPGANYSRFSHSVGAFRNVTKLLDAIVRNSSDENEKRSVREVQQRYRIAALLHDVGHFPFSHATETAFHELKEEMAAAEYAGSQFELFTSHEDFGAEIIRSSSELVRMLDGKGISPDDIASVFSSDDVIDVDGLNLRALVSSELDCDRLDYLKRTSYFTGLPFGNVDIDYIINGAMISHGRVCFNHKSKKSADHLLIARFHDYSQVVFHKKLISLEWSLKECIKECVRTEQLRVSKEHLMREIRDDGIKMFDDNHFISSIKEMSHHHRSLNDPLCWHSNSVLFGQCATQLYISQRFVSDKRKGHEERKNSIQLFVDNFIDANGINPKLVHVWSKAHSISKLEASDRNQLTYTERENVLNIDELVHIQVQDPNAPPVPLIFFPDSIVGEVAKSYLSDIRVFAFFSNEMKDVFDKLMMELNQGFSVFD